MNSKRILITTLIAVLGILFLGCQLEEGKVGSIWKPKQSQNSFDTVDIKTDFSEDKIVAQAPFDYLVTIINNGDYTIPSGSLKVRIIGIDPMDFSISNVEQVSESELEPKNEFSRGIHFEFQNLRYNYKLGTPVTFHSFGVGVMYEYEERGNFEMCIKKSTSTECEDEGYKSVSTTKGHFTISDVEVKWIESKRAYKLSFTVSKKNNNFYVNDEFVPFSKVDKRNEKINLKFKILSNKITGATCKILEEDNLKELSVYNKFISFRLKKDGTKTLECYIYPDFNRLDTDYINMNLEMVLHYFVYQEKIDPITIYPEE